MALFLAFFYLNHKYNLANYAYHATPCFLHMCYILTQVLIMPSGIAHMCYSVHFMSSRPDFFALVLNPIASAKHANGKSRTNEPSHRKIIAMIWRAQLVASNARGCVCSAIHWQRTSILTKLEKCEVDARGAQHTFLDATDHASNSSRGNVIDDKVFCCA